MSNAVIKVSLKPVHKRTSLPAHSPRASRPHTHTQHAMQQALLHVWSLTKIPSALKQTPTPQHGDGDSHQPINLQVNKKGKEWIEGRGMGKKEERCKSNGDRWMNNMHQPTKITRCNFALLPTRLTRDMDSWATIDDRDIHILSTDLDTRLTLSKLQRTNAPTRDAYTRTRSAARFGTLRLTFLFLRAGARGSRRTRSRFLRTGHRSG